MTRPDIEAIDAMYNAPDTTSHRISWLNSIDENWPTIRDYIAELEKRSQHLCHLEEQLTIASVKKDLQHSIRCSVDDAIAATKEKT